MITDFCFRLVGSSSGLQRQLRRLFIRLPRRRRIVEHKGQRLIVDPTEITGYYLYYERVYDNAIFDFLEKVIHDYRWVIDIGANIGVYTVFFAARVAKVDAFEPIPQVAKRLRENIALNRLRNVSVHELCVAEKDSSVQISQPSAANWGLGRIAVSDGGHWVPSVCLDSFLGPKSTDGLLIKMDIEGAEWLAFAGAKAILKNPSSRMAILLETHPATITNYGGSLEALYRLLITNGFSVHNINKTGLGGLSLDPPGRFWWITPRQQACGSS